MGAQSVTSSPFANLKNRYRNAAEKWNPTKYDLFLSASKERVCRFIAAYKPMRQNETLSIADEHFKRSLEPLFTFWKFDPDTEKENFELVEAADQFVVPGLKIVLKTGATKEVYTHLTPDLFPFPHYLEPNGDYRDVSNIKKVVFEKGTWRITVTFLDGEERVYYASPMQWAEGAWKQAFGNNKEALIESVTSVDMKVLDTMMPVIIQNKVNSGDYG